MNKRHYEHTLPNIRGSLSNTYFPVIVDVIAIYIILSVLLVYGFLVRFVTGKEKQDKTDNRNKD